MQFLEIKFLFYWFVSSFNEFVIDCWPILKSQVYEQPQMKKKLSLLRSRDHITRRFASLRESKIRQAKY